MYKASDLLETKGSRIPVGIHENCTVKSITVGERYIDFNYEKDGATNNKRVWFTTADKVWTRDGESKEAAFERSKREDLAHVTKHLHIFLTEDEFGDFEAKTYEEYINKAAAILEDKLDRKKVNLKLCYDKEGMYSEFGRFPDYIEEYKEEQKPTLYFTPYEQKHRLKAATNSVATSDAPVVGTDDLY